MKTYDDCEFSQISNFLNTVPSDIVGDVLVKNSLFHMHIPKTGGTYVKNLLAEINLLKHYSPGHMKCSENFYFYPDPSDSIPKLGLYQNQEGFKESLRFCVIRNPFEWLVSFYYHTNNFADFNQIEQKGVGGVRGMYPNFSRFVEAYCNDKDFWPLGLKFFRDFFPFQIFDDDGYCKSDLILKNGMNNELTNAMTTLLLLNGIDIETIARAHQRLSEKKLYNASSSRPYKDVRRYYKDSEIQLLNFKWQNILDVCGYNFNGSSDNKIMISGKNIKYNFDKNIIEKIR